MRRRPWRSSRMTPPASQPTTAPQKPDSDHRRIKLVFETGSLRSQVVLIWYLTLNDGKEEWVQIESPFGELGTLDLTRALQEISNTVCGGLALVGNLVTFRHSLPLENL